MIGEEDLFLGMGGSRLRLEIDRVPLWRGEGAHVGVKQLVDDFAQYTYLPRVRDGEEALPGAEGRQGRNGVGER